MAAGGGLAQPAQSRDIIGGVDSMAADTAPRLDDAVTPFPSAQGFDAESGSLRYGLDRILRAAVGGISRHWDLQPLPLRWQSPLPSIEPRARPHLWSAGRACPRASPAGQGRSPAHPTTFVPQQRLRCGVRSVPVRNAAAPASRAV